MDLRACTLARDFDCDGRVDVADIQQVAARWGISRGQAGYYPPFDRDGDEDIDVDDLQEVAGLWRRGCQE